MIFSASGGLVRVPPGSALGADDLADAVAIDTVVPLAELAEQRRYA